MHDSHMGSLVEPHVCTPCPLKSVRVVILHTEFSDYLFTSIHALLECMSDVISMPFTTELRPWV